MSWRVRVTILESGERLPLLVRGGPRGSPDADVTRYALACLRQRDAVSTMKRKLAGIALGREFVETRSIDLVERAAKGTFLSHDELTAFAKKCRTRRDGSGAVTTAVAAEHYRAFLDYLRWVSEPIIARVSDDARRAALLHAAERFRMRTLAATPHAQGPAGSRACVQDRYGLDPEQRALLRRAITPCSPENPWGDSVQHRNHAILTTLLRLGPRTGEMLGLKVRDFRQVEDPATLTIHRRHDDPDDPRADQPVAKTLPRVLQLEEDHRAILDSWVSQHRSDRRRFPHARTHPFLFVNREGRPLGKGGYQKIFKTLRMRHPELEGLVSHMLRHDWNERWTEMAEEKRWDPGEAGKDQRYAMGWSNISKMPGWYSKRAIRKRANKRVSTMQRRALGDEA